MREIKFRGWDSWLNVMATDVKDFEEAERIELQAFGWTSNVYAKDEFYAPIILMKARFDEMDGRLIWMQYTGLKDKNGVEIYEGDIFAPSWTHELVEVSLDPEDGNFHHHEVEYGQAKFGEVIGNIYENPELLK